MGPLNQDAVPVGHDASGPDRRQITIGVPADLHNGAKLDDPSLAEKPRLELIWLLQGLPGFQQHDVIGLVKMVFRNFAQMIIALAIRINPTEQDFRVLRHPEIVRPDIFQNNGEMDRFTQPNPIGIPGRLGLLRPHQHNSQIPDSRARIHRADDCRPIAVVERAATRQKRQEHNGAYRFHQHNLQQEACRFRS